MSGFSWTSTARLTDRADLAISYSSWTRSPISVPLPFTATSFELLSGALGIADKGSELLIRLEVV